MNARRIVQAVRWIVLGMWPSASFAGQVMFDGQSFGALPPALWVSAVVMSVLGSVTSLLWKVQLMLSANEPVPAGRVRLAIFLAANLCMSLFAGTVAFLIGLHTQMPFFLLALTIGLAAFLGAKFIDMTIGKFIK